MCSAVDDVASLEAEIREWAGPVYWAGHSAVVSIGMTRGILPRIVRELSGIPIIIYDPRLPDSAPIADWPNTFAAKDLPALRIRVRDFVRHDERTPLIVHCDSADPELTDEQETVERAIEQVYKLHAYEQRSARTSMLMRTALFLDLLPRLADRVPVNHIAGAMAGVPAVCVGGGPSVDRQIDALRAVRDRVLVIGVNTSAPALLAAGITPDIVVTCEAKAVAESMADSVRGSVLVPGLHVNRAIWDLPAERIAPALSMEGAFGVWLCEQLGCEPIEIGGSAGTLTGGVARILGCNPIILLGHDCCSDPETGALYSSQAQWAGTTVERKDGAVRVHRSEAKRAADASVRGGDQPEADEEHIVHVPSWDGEGEVICHGPYDALRQWWEESAVAAPFRGRTLINASVGGARLYGWESRRIEDLELPEQDEAPGARLRRALADAGEVDAGTLRRAVGDHRKTLDRSRELAAEGEALCKRMREIQIEFAGMSSSVDLLDSYSYGQFEADRIHGDREPLFDRMGVLLGDIRQGAECLDEQLAIVQDRLR